MLGLDWAHTRDFAVYDGKEASLMAFPQALEKAKADGGVAIEAGAPLTFLYRLVRAVPTVIVSPFEVAEERERQGLEKSDLNDAQVIWSLGQRDGRKPLALADDRLRLLRLYHEYDYALKAKVAQGNLLKAMKRHFGDAETSTAFLFSCHLEDLERRVEVLQAELERLAPEPPPSLLKLKGFSRWLWAGIIIAADPRLFPTKQAYRTYCGLIDREAIKHRFSRRARRAYWLVVDQFVKQRTPGWRELYDQKKEELTGREGYTHPHGGAANRVATAFCNYVFDVVRKEILAQQGQLWA